MNKFSFELFPPQTLEKREKLVLTCHELAALGPEYFSVTFGAGGSTREGTRQVVENLLKEGLAAVPHISCAANSRNELAVLLADYKKMGVRRLVALRGDLPSGMASAGELRHASDLVSFIRQTTGQWFHIEVAAYPEAHPESENLDVEIKHFKSKVEAGAQSALTQFFYNTDAYFNFVDRCARAGISIPIVPGIMPIANFARIVRFTEFCGAEIPRWLRRQFEAFKDDPAAAREFVLDMICNLCQQLLDGGAPGLHFYTLNRSDLVKEIWSRLHLPVKS